MTLAFPASVQAVATRINGKDLALGADTLSAAESVVLEGEVEDLGQFEHHMAGYGTRPAVQEALASEDRTQPGLRTWSGDGREHS